MGSTSSSNGSGWPWSAIPGPSFERVWAGHPHDCELPVLGRGVGDHSPLGICRRQAAAAIDHAVMTTAGRSTSGRRVGLAGSPR
jgi:hypothetical protein